MVFMTPVESRSSSFKKRELQSMAADDESHNDDVRFKRKKPEKLQLQRVSDNYIIINGNDEGLMVNDKELHAAATKLQKFYRSYRTRRNLADCAVVVEELWWKALEFAALRRSSVSFFNSNKSETAVSRWARARTRAAKVGKGLSKDVKGQQLALRHWLEAIDPRHRYGHNLHLYYGVWFESGSSQPFFYWLDVGDGKEINIDKCPRTNLQRECIKYLGPKEREAYEVVLNKGKLIYKQSKTAVNTIEGTKWIFVLSTSRILYVGQKQKGLFHHSSFLAGGATVASGRLVVHHGTLHAVWPYSGHYRPTEENFIELCSFLEDHHVDLTNVKKHPTDDDIPSNFTITKEPKAEMTSFKEMTEEIVPIHAKGNHYIRQESQQQSHSNKETIGERNRLVDVDKGVVAYELGKKSMAVNYKWSTGVGPRIGCVRDYPSKLQFKALEQVNLSPRLKPSLMTNRGSIPSPRPSPNVHLSPGLAYLGLVSPRVRVSASN